VCAYVLVSAATAALDMLDMLDSAVEQAEDTPCWTLSAGHSVLDSAAA
jgi:hypothetical protein